MFGNNRQSIRRFFAQCRQKELDGQPLESLERLVVDILRDHPEYHPYLGEDEESLQRDFPPELGQSNPFLHMGMHITLREQLTSDRPAGIRPLYQQITARFAGDSHSAEHQMMECLGLALWEAQQQQKQPDEQRYLECLRKIARQ